MDTLCWSRPSAVEPRLAVGQLRLSVFAGFIPSCRQMWMGWLPGAPAAICIPALQGVCIGGCGAQMPSAAAAGMRQQQQQQQSQHTAHSTQHR
eukprot:COSAG01_NODE_1066_length_11878_cov_244.494949_15_plen_93_part_00